MGGILKAAMPMQNKLVFAQVNPTPGDIEGNYKIALEYVLRANKEKVSAIVFPELFLMGYPVMDLIDRYPDIVQKNVDYLNRLAEATAETKVLTGFVEFNESKTGRRYYDSAAVLQNGKVVSVVQKTLLCEYSEFNEARYFQPGKFDSSKRIVEIAGKRAGILICEEEWADSDFFENQIYGFDPLKTLIEEQKPDFIINLSASPTRAKKEQLRHNLLSYLSKKYATPMLYANQVGAVDSINFAGGSCVYDSYGTLVARAKSFEEEYFEVNLDFLPASNAINPLPEGLEKTLDSKKVFTLEHGPDLARTYLTIVQSIRDYFRKTGFKRAVLGLSGGLDSSICAALLSEALGFENVLGVSMPSNITSEESRNDARELARRLKINFLEIPIKDMVESTKETLDSAFFTVEKFWNGRFKQPLTFDNIQARARATILWGISNEFKDILPIATSDKSELYMGYATINGDMSGGYAPICDVVKTKLFALADWINKNNGDVIPAEILKKRPGAELAVDPKTGKPLLAEDALMPYEFLDEVIWRLENFHQGIDEMLKEKFVFEAKNNLSMSQKEEWLKKFFRRVQSALYKWTLMPVGPIIDARSINKAEYSQPIVSKINS